ncbi:Rv2732c family membrane protein [Rhodococcus sp. NPDC003348]
MTDDLSAPSDDLSAYEDDLSAIERRVTREFSFGRLRPVVVGLIATLVVALFLPHAGGHSAVAVIGGAGGAGVTVPLRLFLGFVVVFGIGVGALAVVTRRWALSWLAMIGTSMGIVFGMLACWSQQSLPAETRPSGLGAGLLLAWAATTLLAIQWASVTWSRANVMQARPKRGTGLRK